jgi:PAS domain S-box-containing protein
MNTLFAQSLAGHFQHSNQFYFIITDMSGNIVHANSLVEKITGFNLRETFSHSMKNIVAICQQTKLDAIIQRAEQKDEVLLSADLKCQLHDKTYLTIYWELSLLPGETGTPDYIQWVGIGEKNIGDMREKNIIDLWERYEAYEYSSEGLWKMNLKKPIAITASPEQVVDHCRKYGYLADCNDNMARMYGFTRADELIGVATEQLLDFDDPVRRNNLVAFVSNNYHLTNVETREYDRYGNVLYFLNNMTGILENGMLTRIWGTQQNITEMVKAQERLQESELFYRSLIADSLDGILLTNEKGVISFASASVKKILGYDPEDLFKKTTFDLMHPADRAQGIAAFYGESESQKKNTPLRLMHKSGEWLWCMVRAHNLISNPHVGAILIYFSDDTVRKKTEEALLESEQRFRHLIHKLTLGVILVDRKGNILVFNQATADMFELSEERLNHTNVLQSTLDIVHEDGTQFSRYDFPIATAIRTKRPVRGIIMGIKLAPDKERMWLLVGAEPILDSDNDIMYILSSFASITEQKQLSEKLMGQQKQLMQATIDAQEKERREIGRELHDNISQHITTTRLYLEVARDKASGELLSLINHAHKGLLDTVNEMRKLSQSLVPPSLSDIGLIESIEDLCSPLKSMHAFTISFQYSMFNEALLPDKMKLMVFRIIQEQINNIIRHANAENIWISLQTPAGKVMISITDNGRGFDPLHVKKGLGFANINSRATLFGGTMKIEAAPGKGCSVQIEIPLAQHQ